MTERPERCPVCRGPVEWQPACPGYERGGTVYVCGPRCGNAAEWRCDAAPPCGWWYREPNRRSDKDRMGARPAWFHDPMAALDDLDVLEPLDVTAPELRG